MRKLKKKFCTISHLEKNTYVKTWINEWKDEVIIFIHNGKIYAKSSICPHFGGPIVYNREKRYLECYWHGLSFSAESGKCLNQKTFLACIDKYNFELKDNNVYIIKNENS